MYSQFLPCHPKSCSFYPSNLQGYWTDLQVWTQCS